MKKKLIFALLAAPVLFGAFKVTDRVTFDQTQWVADFEQLKDEIENNYANLKWAGPAKHVDLAALNETTLAALQNAKSNSQARAALAEFIEGFKDNHFHIESGPPRPVAAVMNLWPESGQPRLNYRMKAGEVCEAFGFNQKKLFIQIDHPGLTESKTTEFAAGVLTLEDGRKFGFIRIPKFQQNDYGASCERAWQTFSTGRSGTCDQACQDEFYQVAKTEVAAQLAREANEIAKEATDGLIIDLTGNGGGTEWADDAAAALTPINLARPAGAFVRGEHWARQFQSDIESFKKEKRDADLAIARSLQDSARATCDLSKIWTDGQRAATCWNVATLTPYSENHFAELKQPNPYAGKLYILVDQATASASEQFTAILQDNKAATVIGSATMGVGCGYTNGGIDIKLRNSGLAIRMPDCARMRADGSNEYEGVRPDIVVDWGASESSKGMALEKALSEIR
jgi:hypothetical protein